MVKKAKRKGKAAATLSPREQQDVKTLKRQRAELRRVLEIERLAKRLRRATKHADAAVLDFARDVLVAQDYDIVKRELLDAVNE